MTSAVPGGPIRVAGAADVEPIVDTLTTAFFNDPLWGPAFPVVERRAAQASALWRLSVTSALRYPWMLVTERAEAVALWVPPGGTELTEAESEGLEAFLVELTDRQTADAILRLFDQFDAARPSEPHFYLSLLGTHSDHRGSGLGMDLLKQSLTRIDALGLPAYLESSNPANDKRYADVGFIRRDEIVTAAGSAFTTMWRPAR
jgi:GNAT superfamily N-acetyltransferase